MRHVQYDHNRIQYPDGWEERAQAALEEVQCAAAGERSNVINAHRTIWADLKSELARIMNGKCWYTESTQAGTDTDVDHFRPKNSVKGVRNGVGEDHPGYWWQAFDPANYRFSCIFANRRRRDIETGITGGKADEFPIWDENLRAWSPDHDCDQEQPLLIDPCNPAEVALIFFGENGEAFTRHKEEDRPRLFAMGEISINLYNINHSDFIKARIRLRDELKKKLNDAKRYYEKLDRGDADNDHAYMRAIEDLRASIALTAPYSRFALDILKPYGHEEYLEPVFY
jgi:hypothetical protein